MAQAALIGVAAAGQIAGGAAASSGHKLAAQLAPVIADVNAKRFDNQATWTEWNAKLDQRTTGRKIQIMKDLGEMERHMVALQGAYASKQGRYQQRYLNQVADVEEQAGQEHRVRMEVESNAHIKSIEARYTKAGVVSNSGSALRVGAESQMRAELAEQEHFRQTADRVSQIRYQAKVARWQGDVSQQLLNYNYDQMKYSLEGSMYMERMQGDIRQLEYANQARNARMQALLTTAQGGAQQYASQQAAKAAMWGGVAGATGTVANYGQTQGWFS